MNNHRLLPMAGIALVLVILPLVASSCIIEFGEGPVPVDAVMVDNELFFVLEKDFEIGSLRVSETAEKEWNPLWFFNARTNEVEKVKYPRLKQIKYGNTPEGFTCVTGPFELQRNVEYSVYIWMGSHQAEVAFIITGDNAVSMPHPRFERQKNRTYSVSIDENGNKILVPNEVE